MKKFLTSAMLGLFLSCMVHAQELMRSEQDHVSAPEYKLTEGINSKALLFENNWVRAKILTSNNSVISNDSFLYNFDKLDKRLLFTKDLKNISELDWREFKAVMFYANDTSYVLEHIYVISNKSLFQVLISGNSRYSLYKTVYTKIMKGSYGSSSYGNSGDRYHDIIEYCIFFPNREYRTIRHLKKSDITKIFKMKPDSGSVDEFLNTVNKEIYEEDDLKQLILYLNKQSM